MLASVFVFYFLQRALWFVFDIHWFFNRREADFWSYNGYDARIRNFRSPVNLFPRDASSAALRDCRSLCLSKC